MEEADSLNEIFKIDTVSLNYKVGVRRSIWHTFKRIGLEPYMFQIPLNINYSISKRFYYGFK